MTWSATSLGLTRMLSLCFCRNLALMTHPKVFLYASEGTGVLDSGLQMDKPDILECDVSVFCVDRIIACSRRDTALSLCSPRFRICPPLIAALKKSLDLSMINIRRTDFTPILCSRTYLSSPGRLISLRLRLSSTVSCSIMT